MRRLELPVSYVQAVLRVLRVFEGEAKTMLADFALPDSLLAPRAPRLGLVMLDGERVYFTLRREGERPSVFGGVNIRHPNLRGRGRRHEGVGRLAPEQAQHALEAARTRTEVDLSRIAQDLDDRLRA